MAFAAEELEWTEGGDDTRSFSTHPGNRPTLTAEQRAELERRESQMELRLADLLARHGCQTAIVMRSGGDLSHLDFETEAPTYTHLGFAVLGDRGWRIRHLLNTHEGAEGHLYDQALVDFFRDDPTEYRVSVLVPSEELQDSIAAVLESPVPTVLHSTRYSRISYPFSTWTQNSNQWLLEVIGAAQGGGETRAEVQRFLAGRRLEPTVLRTVGVVGQAFAGLLSRNTRFDDHPLRNRLRGRIEFMMDPSIRAYLHRFDAVRVEEVLRLDDPSETHGGRSR